MKQKSFFRFPAIKSGNPKSKIKNPKWLGPSIIAFVLVVAGAVAEAQQAGKVARIGYLDDSTTSRIAVRLETLRQELSKLCWNEGNNLTIDSRYAEGKNDRLPELAADLVRLKVDLIVVSATPAALAAYRVYRPS